MMNNPKWNFEDKKEREIESSSYLIAEAILGLVGMGVVVLLAFVCLSMFVYRN